MSLEVSEGTDVRITPLGTPLSQLLNVVNVSSRGNVAVERTIAMGGIDVVADGYDAFVRPQVSPRWALARRAAASSSTSRPAVACYWLGFGWRAATRASAPAPAGPGAREGAAPPRHAAACLTATPPPHRHHRRVRHALTRRRATG